MKNVGVVEVEHAEPVQATVVVPEIKVRLIPPESRLYQSRTSADRASEVPR